MGGVEGLPSPTAPEVLARVAREIPALEAMAKAVRESPGPIHLLASGPLTNIALFISVYPSLMSKVEAIVFMGGGIGMGNKSSAAGTLSVRRHRTGIASLTPSIQSSTSYAIVSYLGFCD